MLPASEALLPFPGKYLRNRTTAVGNDMLVNIFQGPPQTAGQHLPYRSLSAARHPNQKKIESLTFNTGGDFKISTAIMAVISTTLLS